MHKVTTPLGACGIADRFECYPPDITQHVIDAMTPRIEAAIKRVHEAVETAKALALAEALAPLAANDHLNFGKPTSEPEAEPDPPAPPSPTPPKRRSSWDGMSATQRSAVVKARWIARKANKAASQAKGCAVAEVSSVPRSKPESAAFPQTALLSRAANDWSVAEGGGMTDKCSVIWTGDCRDAFSRIPKTSIDLIVTSPPYPEHGLEYERPADSSVHAWVELMGDFLAEARDVLKPGGNLWINVGFERVRDERGHDTRQRIPLTYRLAPLIEAAGLKIMNEIIWLKPQHQNAARHRLSTKSERWLWLFKPGAKPHFDIEAVRIQPKTPDPRNNPRGSNPADIWTFAGVNGNDRRRVAHPCQFPEEMIERIVKGWSKPGDLVLDPFAGSGTVGAVAQRHGRRSLLIEREAKYVEIARQRLAA